VLRRSGLRLVAAFALLLGCGGPPAVTSDAADPPTSDWYDAAALTRTDAVAGLAAWTDLAVQFPSSVVVARGRQDAQRTLLPPSDLESAYDAEADADATGLDWYLHGRARIDRPELARAAFKRSQELDPGNAWAVTGLAYLHYARGDLFQALQEYETALADAPRSSTLRQNLAGLYLELKLFIQAQRHLEIAHRLDPQDPEIVAALGQAYYGLGYVERAIEWLERARAMEPRVSTVYAGLASLYLRTGRAEEAHDAYVTGLRLGQPEDAELAIEIRVARVTLGATEAAAP